MNRLERFGTERPMNLVVITDGRELIDSTATLSDRFRSKSRDARGHSQLRTKGELFFSWSRGRTDRQQLDQGSYPPAQLGVQFLQIGDDIDVS